MAVIATGLFTLAGVLIGQFFGLRSERRRAAREIAARLYESHSTVRGAIRTVSAEIRLNQSVIDEAARHQRSDEGSRVTNPEGFGIPLGWWPDPDTLSFRAWDQHAAILAGHLDREEWDRALDRQRSRDVPFDVDVQVSVHEIQADLAETLESLEEFEFLNKGSLPQTYAEVREMMNEVFR